MKVSDEVSKIALDLEIERFDKIFAEAGEDDLPELKNVFPFLFSKRYHDSIWIKRMNDTLQIQLLEEIDNILGSLSEENVDIELFYKHLKFHKKTFNVPRVITVGNYVDYKNKVVVTDSIVLIDLANYLGSNHEFYQGIQEYIRKNFESSQITSDLAAIYAEKELMQPSRPSFLDDMIAEGKKLYFKDIMLPTTADTDKIGFTQAELDWAKANEANIWSYFIERELLYQTDAKLTLRFISPAPFSKFGLELDNESPGGIGRYIGWQIVRAYAENNDDDWETIMRMTPETLFKNSRFKPRK